MKQQLLNEICQLLKERDFKGPFRMYIDMTIQTNPEELLAELYGQIIGNLDDNDNEPNELFGKKIVKLIRQYFES